MNYNTKLALAIIMSIFELSIISREKSDKDQISIKNQNTINIIFQMEESVALSDQHSFKNLLDTYINQFGQVYEKEEGFLNGYAIIYHIRSQENYNLPITPREISQLITILNQATYKTNWGDSISLDLPVTNFVTLKKAQKHFTLNQIIDVIQKPIDQPTEYSYKTKLATASILGALAMSCGLYYFVQQHPESIENLSYAWEDFKNNAYQIKAYFTDPQNYQQFEKEHDLNSEDMSRVERLQRFWDWQTGKQIQQNIDKQMIQVQRFEKKMALTSDNMPIEDRIATYKEWKKQELIAERARQKMIPIEKFEKQHDLNSHTMDVKERITRYKKWLQGDKHQKNLQEKMVPVKKFEKQHDLDSDTMDEKQRIQRYREWKKGHEHQQYIDEKMVKVKAFEKEKQLSTDNMHYEDRIKIFDTWQQEQVREKMITAIILWEETNKDSNWLMENNIIYDRKTDSWIREKKELNEDERIARYQRQTNEVERWFLENQNTMKAVEAFEKKMNLSTQNMYYQDRVKILSEWQQEQAREKSIKGMSAWEQKFNVSITSKRPILIEMSAEERIDRFNDYYCGTFWGNPSIKAIENFEADYGHSSMKETNEYETMNDDERLERYQDSTTQDQRFLWENFGNDFKFI